MSNKRFFIGKKLIMGKNIGAVIEDDSDPAINCESPSQYLSVARRDVHGRLRDRSM